MLSFSDLKHYFLAGLFAIIPIVVTVNIFKFLINFLSNWLIFLHKIIPIKIAFIPYIEIITASMIVLLIGYLVNNYLITKILEYFEEYIIKNVPFANTVYFGIKKITTMLQKKSEKNEEQLVAWVRLPCKNVFCLGLMTGKLDSSISPEKDKQYFCFFIPHTPNPVTGYYIISAEEDCVFTNISRQEAISLIMSGGILKPER
jgi:uncharacterized membrane protein